VPILSPKNTLVRRSFFGALGTSIPCGIWAAAIEPNRLSITQKEITLKYWPQSLDGFRIAQLTDIHYRPEQDAQLLRKTIEHLRNEPVDLIALTGDYIISDDSVITDLCKELSKISAEHGIFACPGNHDRWHVSNYLLKTNLQKAGIVYLRNQGIKLNIKGENIFINGLDSIWAGQPLINHAWSEHQGETPVISLVHEPDPFDELRAEKRIDLQLSGHTHGGQCRIPILGVAPVKVKYGRKYLYGHYQHEESHLWVGRGIGTVGPRVRFACPPELAILTLRSSS